MITIKDFMECIDYKITEGSEYSWKCFGKDAYSLDYWTGDNDNGHSIGVTFDRKTHVVYQMTICDYANDRAYCWTHPDWIKQYQQEADRKLAGQYAWGDVKYINIDLSEEILEKAINIAKELPYDTRITVSVDLPKEELFDLMSMAHEKDITLNQLVEEILVEVLNREEK